MPDSDLAIRAATAADYQRLCDADRAAFGAHAYDRYALRQLLELFPSTTLLAEDPMGAVLGFAIGGVAAPVGIGWVLSVGVGPASRGRGVGRQLSLALLSALRALGLDRVRLTVEPANTRAMSLYRSLGFRPIDSVPAGEALAYFGPGEERVVMELTFARDAATDVDPTGAR